VRLRLGSALRVAAAVACLAMLGQSAAAQQRIAAVVNDEVVTVQDLNERLDLVMFTSGVEDTFESRAGLTPQVLRGLVEAQPELEIRILVWSYAVIHAPGDSKALLLGVMRHFLRIGRDFPEFVHVAHRCPSACA